MSGPLVIRPSAPRVAGALLLAPWLLLAAWAVADGVPGWMVLLLLAPLLEECVFRAGVHEALLRTGGAPWTANAITAALFGLMHAIVRADPLATVVALPALAIGKVYAKWRRVWPCVLLHSAMNACWVIGQVWVAAPTVIR